jgi:hypothetical protein
VEFHSNLFHFKIISVISVLPLWWVTLSHLTTIQNNRQNNYFDILIFSLLEKRTGTRFNKKHFLNILISPQLWLFKICEVNNYTYSFPWWMLKPFFTYPSSHQISDFSKHILWPSSSDSSLLTVLLENSESCPSNAPPCHA